MSTALVPPLSGVKILGVPPLGRGNTLPSSVSILRAGLSWKVSAFMGTLESNAQTIIRDMANPAIIVFFNFLSPDFQ